MILFVFVFSNTLFLSPQKVEAIASGSAITGYVTTTVVGDVPLTWKTGMDIAAYTVAKFLIAEITNSIVNWINSGFEGDPTFVSNPQDFFLGIANEATGVVIQETLAGQLFCDPYRPQILLALTQTNTYSQRAQCTLLDVVDNVDGFLNDFSQGGWAGWIQLTQNPQNNIYGSYLIAVDERNRRVSQAVGNAKAEVSQGQGFISLKRCKKGTELLGPDITNSEADLLGPDISETTTTKGGCAESDKEVVTPGKVIVEQLNLALGSPIRQGELADTIGESIATIFNTLISQLLLTGVRSLSGTGDNGGSLGWYEQGLEDGKTELIDRIDSSIALKEARLGLNEKINSGLLLASETRACYSEQITTISKVDFNPPNLQVVPTKESIDKKIKIIEGEETKAKEFKSEGKKDEALKEITELQALRKKVLEAETLTDVAQRLDDLSKFEFGRQGNFEKDYDKYSNKQEDRQIVKNLEEELLNVKKELAQCGADLEVLQSYVGAEVIPIPVVCVEDSCKNPPQQQQQK